MWSDIQCKILTADTKLELYKILIRPVQAYAQGLDTNYRRNEGAQNTWR